MKTCIQPELFWITHATVTSVCTQKVLTVMQVFLLEFYACCSDEPNSFNAECFHEKFGGSAVSSWDAVLVEKLNTTHALLNACLFRSIKNTLKMQFAHDKFKWLFLQQHIRHLEFHSRPNGHQRVKDTVCSSFAGLFCSFLYISFRQF